MFAIAAFALGGMMVTPAFASSYEQEVNTTADNYAYKNEAQCNGDNLITRVTPNASQDYVKVVTDGDACSTFSSVTITVWVDGTWQGSTTTTNDNATHWFQGITGMSIGHSVKVISEWNY